MQREIIGQIEWVPVHGRWHKLVLSRGELWEVRYAEAGEPAVRLTGSVGSDWLALLTDYKKNRLAYFLPHGPAEGGGKDFLNDWTNEIPILLAPPRTGKSAHGVAFTLMRGIKCDPEWHVFKHHGVKFHEWRGPRKLVISSYLWSNVQELWDEYRKWCPRELLGVYAEDWGAYDGEHGRGRTLSFASGRSQACKLTDGTELVFLCDGQPMGAWEGKRWDDHHCDEQREKNKFISYLRGTQNTHGLVQCCMTLSGYKLDERPDTGASGWIKTELWDGDYAHGRRVGRYRLTVDTTPDAVMSKATKAQLFRQWDEEPKRNQDIVTLRKAEARLWGGWESGSGLVIDNFFAGDHVVPDYDRKHQVVQEATKYRGIDHALGGPCAGAYVEVFPWGQMVMYREYYQTGQTVPGNARGIVEACGNRLEPDTSYGPIVDDASGRENRQWLEVPQNESFFETVMDGRSFAQKAQERQATIGQLYAEAGLCCKPASGLNGDKLIPNMLAYLRLDRERPHIMWYFRKAGIVTEAQYAEWLEGRKGDWKNGALLYFVASLRWAFIEINKWAWTDSLKTGRRVPKKEHDHLVGGGLKYLLAERPVYWGKEWDMVGKREDADEQGRESGERNGFKYVG
jgi:hypothetical protein